jgi:hypothetical protein
MKMQAMTPADVETFHRVKERIERGVTGFRECTRDELLAIMRHGAFYEAMANSLAEKAMDDHARITAGMEY